MKILYIAEHFSPVSKVAAIRSTKLAKYLTRRGHEVTVLCRDWGADVPADSALQRDEKEIARVLRVKNSGFFVGAHSLNAAVLRGMVCVYHALSPAKKTGAAEISCPAQPKAAAPAAPRKKGVQQRVYEAVRPWDFLWDNLDYARQGKKILRQLGDEHFDAIISSYGPFSSHILGLYVKKKYHGCWIADYRDQLQYVQDDGVIGRWCRKLQKNVAFCADHITAVSEGCLVGMPEEGVKKATVITNGFDPEDHKSGVAVPADGMFRLVYTGQMYAGKRDLQPVFRALKELAAEEKLDFTKVEIHYAGDNGAECCRQAAAYGAECRVVDHGYISRDEALALQGKSNVLLLASWNNTGNTGIVTGKVFEYFMANKPIICTISGDLPGSILKQMICDANAGCCYEEAAKQEDFPKLKEELLKQYRIAMGEAGNDFCLNGDYVHTFTFDKKAEAMEKLMNA